MWNPLKRPCLFPDEVTSGMDPYSRRSTWACLERHKRGRVMLLTTHFMDEGEERDLDQTPA
eukprot:52367-Eustigmatos_ZCMA.PRE.1